MNINQLEYFVAATHLGSFSSAAKELYVTPQTVSKAVGDLESELQEPLFERTGRGAEPTPFAKVFSRQAMEVICEFEDLRVIAHDRALPPIREGSISLLVAASPCRGSVLLPHDLDGFRDAFPHIGLSISYASIGGCVDSLKAGLVDAIVVPGHLADKDCVCLKIFSRSLRIAVARSNPLAAHSYLGPKDLHESSIATPIGSTTMHEALASWLAEHGVRPRYVFVRESAETYASFMEQAEGMVFVLEDPALDEELPSAVRLPLASQRLSAVPIFFAYSKRNGNPALRSMERYLLAAS